MAYATGSGVARLSSLLTGLIVIFIVGMILFGVDDLSRMTQIPMGEPDITFNRR